MFRHELNKLINLNHPRTILIYLFQYLLDMLISIVITQRVHQILELSLINAARMVAVKDFKGLAEDFDLLLGEWFLFLFVFPFLLWLADNGY